MIPSWAGRRSRWPRHRCPLAPSFVPLRRPCAWLPFRPVCFWIVSLLLQVPTLLCRLSRTFSLSLAAFFNAFLEGPLSPSAAGVPSAAGASLGLSGIACAGLLSWSAMMLCVVCVGQFLQE
jgi:hypothetical protein